MRSSSRLLGNSPLPSLTRATHPSQIPKHGQAKLTCTVSVQYMRLSGDPLAVALCPPPTQL